MTGSNKNLRPLFVDLDETLVLTDTLWESCLLYIKRYPIQSWRLIIWLFYGKAYFKEQIARKVIPDAEELPYNTEVVKYIRKQKEDGKDIYLLTAANQRIADSVSKFIKIFTVSIGSSSNLNLKGKEKLRVIKEIAGTEQFDYIGDSKVDIPIFIEANTAIICNNYKRIINKFNIVQDKITILPNTRTNLFSQWIKALRVHQWSKNMLLFLAILMSHRILEPNLFKQVLVAFFSFSLSASAVYILNDLFDLEADRKHPSKKNRPFASGQLSVVSGIFAIPILLILSFILAFRFFMVFLFKFSFYETLC